MDYQSNALCLTQLFSANQNSCNFFEIQHGNNYIKVKLYVYKFLK